jgi:hypothetical protein
VGLILALAAGAVAIAIRDRANRIILAALLGTGLLVPLWQANIHTLTSLNKHVAFGAWFAAIAVGYGADRTVAWLAARSRKRAAQRPAIRAEKAAIRAARRATRRPAPQHPAPAKVAAGEVAAAGSRALAAPTPDAPTPGAPAAGSRASLWLRMAVGAAVPLALVPLALVGMRQAQGFFAWPGVGNLIPVLRTVITPDARYLADTSTPLQYYLPGTTWRQWTSLTTDPAQAKAGLAHHAYALVIEDDTDDIKATGYRQVATVPYSGPDHRGSYRILEYVG